MCGRLNVIDDPLVQQICHFLGMDFSTETNTNLCPTQSVSTIILNSNGYQQLNAHWGIKPDWSKQLIINARSETATTKKTFRNAFYKERCLVPCSGWYEWKTAENQTKQKYLFQHTNTEPFFMAGIYYQTTTENELVTLTTSPNQKCGSIHSRMPLLIAPNDIERWFTLDIKYLVNLMKPFDEELIQILPSVIPETK